jgi:hypothetical protein
MTKTANLILALFSLFAFSLSSQACEENYTTLVLNTGYFANEINFNIENEDGEILFDLLEEQEGIALSDNFGYVFTTCLPDGCYTLNMFDTFGDGWNGASVQVIVNNELTTFALETGEFSSAVFSANCGGGGDGPILGCTDPEASNYNPNATEDDGSCVYPEPCEENTLEVWFNAGTWPDEVSWEIIGPDSSFYYFGNASDQTDDQLLELCVPDGCYELNLYDSFGDGWNGAIIGIYLEGQILIDASLPSGNFDSFVFGVNAECEDDEEPVLGCTDPMALNYDPNATQNDGSCEYIEVDNDLCADATPLEEGTITINNVGAINNENIYGECWNSGGGEGEQTSIWFSFTTPADPATIHIEASGDGTNTFTDTQFGLFEECGGEMIYCDGNSGQGLFSAFNFQCGQLAPSTEYLLVIDGWYGDSGTCLLTYEVDVCEPLAGCTDPSAINYNPAAVVDDGSCEYIEDCNDNIVEIITETQVWGNEIGWVIFDADSNNVAMGEGFNSNDVAIDIVCLPDGCYTLDLYDSFGDGWNGSTINLVANGTDVVFTTLDQGFFGTVTFGLGDVDCEESQDDTLGCTDPAALNYNPEATIDDGSCEYEGPCELNTINFITTTEIWANEISWLLFDADGNIIWQGGDYENNSLNIEELCLADGCYTLELYDSFGDGWNNAFISVLSEDETLVLTTLEDGDFTSVTFGVNADCGDNPIDIFGCTDPVAFNYDPQATIDDGSCEYDFECVDNTITLTFDIAQLPDSAYLQYGIGQSYNAYFITGNVGTGNTTYSFDACIPDGCFSIYLESFSEGGWAGSSVTGTVNGEVVFVAAPTENLPLIEIPFGVNSDCEEILGCTDPQAINYNPEATADDGSCEYVECEANIVTINLSTELWGEEVVWTIVDENLNAVASGNGYNSNSDYSIDVCLEDGCYGFIMLDLFGDGWNGAFATIEMNGDILGEGTLESGDEGSFTFGVNSECGTGGFAPGCTDETAINYDPEANLNDGSCVYSLYEGPMAALTDQEVVFSAMLLPNPGIGPVNLKIDALNPEEATLVEIHDMTGRLVFSANYGRDQANLNEVIDISEFAAGMHLVTITNGQTREVIRLIKQH